MTFINLKTDHRDLNVTGFFYAAEEIISDINLGS